MKTFSLAFLLLLATTLRAADNDGFIQLFNGKDLNDWKASDKPGTFSVQDGLMVVNGPRSHLFYVGPVCNHDFKNFHMRVELMTFPHANSGVYFHTEFQEAGWPNKGFEVQVNNSHKDPKRTAGLYDIKDVYEVPARDNEWFVMEIIVEGKHVITKVNGKVYVDYVEPADFQPPKNHIGRIIAHGTFAIQGHDPGSKIYYKSIAVKPMP
jgi:Domain of Unknown Function (DUF1080)